ncbi:MAG: DpnD/PcfM family protein [Clostridiaceae bacterium]|nr:DpnD/PcfM family protein [Clostridiaceae bacterium]
MRKFTVVIEETLVQEFEIIAENENDALNLAAEKYRKCELVLDAGEVQYKQMAIIEPDNKETEWIEF